jgi:hypothetical protein
MPENTNDEDDLILDAGGNDRDPELNIIDNQLILINTMLEIEQEPYNDWLEEKIKILARAMKIIYKTQAKLLKP